MNLQIAIKFFVVVFALVFSSVKADGQNEIKYIPSINSELTDTIITDNGDVIIRVRVPGVPPKSHIITKSTTILPASAIVLNEVPAFSWSFGCSPTVGAMMAGYFDRNGYPEMYIGPTDGGVCPLNNSSWGNAVINGNYENLCPLSATRQGLDGRTSRGHVDDYWINYGSNLTDPYITNGWTEHEHEDCTADFMKTSRSVYGYEDGATMFYFYSNGNPYSVENNVEGTCGLKLFFESRGYNVKRWLSQYLTGYSGVVNGFSFNDYKTEIDEGRPVMVHLEGHSVLGIGYDTDNESIYFHDTWDYDVHSVEWGGIYISPPYSLQMFGVSVYELEPNIICSAPLKLNTINITSVSTNLIWDTDYSNNDFEILYGETGFNPAEGSLILVEDTNQVVLNNLLPETQYTSYVRMVCGGDYSEWSDSISFRTYSIQKIELTTGWNIMSANLLPANPDMEAVFQSLISNGSLVKIQDESGNSVENLGIYGDWTNNIGDIELTEGYKVKMSGNDSIQIYGSTMANYPYAIPLKTGWNIIGYPQIKTFDGLDVVQELIDRNTLIKVQDKAGYSIEDLGIYGEWTNNIGNFITGEGYKIKVSDDDTLWISDSYTKSATFQSERVATTHFIPAYKGNGNDHMNIHLVNLAESGIWEADEIGVFDGNICVGSAKIQNQLPIASRVLIVNRNSVSIPVSASDEIEGRNGFTAGNAITLKFYRNGAEYPLSVEPLNNRKPVFEKGGTLVALVGLATEFDRLNVSGLSEIKLYPNPFRDEVTIEIKLQKDFEVEVEVLNHLGQRVKFVTTKQIFPGGEHKLTWNGRNANNRQVSPGIYHLYIGIDDVVYYRKIILSK